MFYFRPEKNEFNYAKINAGTELVHDEAEKSLLREVEYLKSGQRRLEHCLDRCKDQVCHW